jgi:hypothetical protein
LLASPFKSNSRLEAENAALRHQLTVLSVSRFPALIGELIAEKVDVNLRPDVQMGLATEKTLPCRM